MANDSERENAMDRAIREIHEYKAAHPEAFKKKPVTWRDWIWTVVILAVLIAAFAYGSWMGNRDNIQDSYDEATRIGY